MNYHYSKQGGGGIPSPLPIPSSKWGIQTNGMGYNDGASTQNLLRPDTVNRKYACIKLSSEILPEEIREQENYVYILIYNEQYKTKSTQNLGSSPTENFVVGFTNYISAIIRGAVGYQVYTNAIVLKDDITSGISAQGVYNWNAEQYAQYDASNGPYRIGGQKINVCGVYPFFSSVELQEKEGALETQYSTILQLVRGIYNASVNIRNSNELVNFFDNNRNLWEEKALKLCTEIKESGRQIFTNPNHIYMNGTGEGAANYSVFDAVENPCERMFQAYFSAMGGVDNNNYCRRRINFTWNVFNLYNNVSGVISGFFNAALLINYRGVSFINMRRYFTVRPSYVTVGDIGNVDIRLSDNENRWYEINYLTNPLFTTNENFQKSYYGIQNNNGSISLHKLGFRRYKIEIL